MFTYLLARSFRHSAVTRRYCIEMIDITHRLAIYDPR